jgi:hypothetical protein
MFYNKPWPHKVIDDYYDGLMVNAAINEIFANLRNDQTGFSTKTADRIFISKENLYSNPKFPCTKNLLMSRNTKALLDDFPEHRPHSSLTLYGECILCLASSDHPIHDESEDKVLSAVTYLHPSEGEGTLLYDETKQFVKQIEWKPNRTLVFAGKTGLTWHSYKSTTNIRLTLNSFLIR